MQHCFDSRGVARVYDVSFDDGILRLWRDAPDFAQRYHGRLSADGTTIDSMGNLRGREDLAPRLRADLQEGDAGALVTKPAHVVSA